MSVIDGRYAGNLAGSVIQELLDHMLLNSELGHLRSHRPPQIVEAPRRQLDRLVDRGLHLRIAADGLLTGARRKYVWPILVARQTFEDGEGDLR